MAMAARSFFNDDARSKVDSRVEAKVPEPVNIAL